MTKLWMTMLLMLAACGTAEGSARMYQTTDSGGEVILEGNYLDRVADAVVLMATHCDGRFLVVDEEVEDGYKEAPDPGETFVEFVCMGRVDGLATANE